MLQHPGVVGAGVVGKPDLKNGEEVVAFVRLRPGSALTTEDLFAYAKQYVSATKYPRDVRIIDRLPLTSMFKLDSWALRGQL